MGIVNLAAVDHPFGFAHTTFDSLRLDQPKLDIDTQYGIDFMFDFFLKGDHLFHFVGKDGLYHLHPYFQRIQASLAVDDKLVVRGYPFHLQKHFLDLRGENIYAAYDKHVVGASPYFMSRAEVRPHSHFAESMLERSLVR